MNSHQLTASVNYSERLRPFAYLFLMDVCRLITTQDFNTYAAKELGYEESLMQAFLVCQKEPRDGKLSHDLFKKVHHAAMAHMPKSKRGEYKTETGNFDIYLSHYNNAQVRDRTLIVPDYAATLLGVVEFIQFWMLGMKPVVHSFGFTSKTKDRYFIAFLAEKGILTYTTVEKGVKKSVPFNVEKHVLELLKHVQEYDWRCAIDSFLYDEQNIAVLLPACMELLFNQFYREIEIATNNDEKIRAIARCMQHVAQLHPFSDGNIRTCYIILNKLLRDYGLTFSLMINPNRFDCFDLEELVRTIKDGQGIFQQLLDNVNPEEMVVTTTEKLGCLKTITAKAHKLKNPALVDEFITTVLLQETPAPINAETVANPVRLFSASSRSDFSVSELIANVRALIASPSGDSPVVTALLEGKYSLALRRSCIGNMPQVVEQILTAREALNIDVNEVAANNNKTALDLFEQITKESPEKEAVKAKLLAAGAVKAATVNLKQRT